MAMVCWMAGLFYLPRLFVYHTKAKNGTEMYQTFSIMEHRLYHYIMTPSMLMTWISGIYLGISIHIFTLKIFWIKMFFVIAITIYHFWLFSFMKKFAIHQNINSEKYFRCINEIPTLFLIIIVSVAIFAPLYME